MLDSVPYERKETSCQGKHTSMSYDVAIHGSYIEPYGLTLRLILVFMRVTHLYITAETSDCG